MTNVARYCQEILISGFGTKMQKPRSDGNHGYIRVDLFFDHILDRPERARQRAWAASTGAFVADLESGVGKFENLEPAAVAGEIRANALVKEIVYLGELWIVARRDSYRTAYRR